MTKDKNRPSRDFAKTNTQGRKGDPVARVVESNAFKHPFENLGRGDTCLHRFPSGFTCLKPANHSNHELPE